jgi:hypothetical protein
MADTGADNPDSKGQRRRWRITAAGLPRHPLQAPADIEDPKRASAGETLLAVLLGLGVVLDAVGAIMLSAGLGPYVLYAGLALTGIFGLPVALGALGPYISIGFGGPRY